MTDLHQRISEFIAKREKATKGEWVDDEFTIMSADGSIVADVMTLDDFPCIAEDNDPEQLSMLAAEFAANANLIVAAANDAVPLLLACQERIRELEHQPDMEKDLLRVAMRVNQEKLAKAERMLKEIAFEPYACGSNGAVIAQSYFEAKDQA